MVCTFFMGHTLDVSPCTLAEPISFDALKLHHLFSDAHDASDEPMFFDVVPVGDTHNVANDDGILTVVANVFVGIGLPGLVDCRCHQVSPAPCGSTL